MRYRDRIVYALAGLALVATPDLFAADASRTRPPWERGEVRAREQRTIEPTPVERPTALRRRPVTVEVAVPNGRLEGEAVRSARRAARRAVAEVGQANYFRVGLYQGLRIALNSDLLGELDYRAGLRDGRRDPEARRLAELLAVEQAANQAIDLAESQVERMYRDLARSPQFDPILPRVNPIAPGPQFDRPRLAELLNEFPLLDSLGRQQELRLFLVGWDWDAARLYSCSDYNDFYAADWDGAGRALNRFKRERRAQLVRLPTVQQRRLENIFLSSFASEIGRQSARLDRAWERGRDAGFAHGVDVRREFDYRNGFADGFERALERKHARLFLERLPVEFDRAYADAYDRWENSVVTEIGAVRMFDISGDDVIEPGEAVVFDVELINYGGRSGSVDVQIVGEALQSDASTVTELPARTRLFRSGLLEAVIDPALAPRSRVALALLAADQRRSVELLVRRPLEIEAGSVRIQNVGLDGRVDVEFELRNISLIDRPAELSVVASGRHSADVVVERSFDRIDAKASQPVRLSLAGLKPIDLVGGDVRLELVVRQAGQLQDRLRRGVSGTATDLRSQDLARLLDQMLDRGTTLDQADRMRELWIARLRVDWKANVRARGNPYKRDYKRGGELTALGELVRLTEDANNAEPALISGLSNDVMRLAGELPGAHPLLRKYVKRLARQLP